MRKIITTILGLILLAAALYAANTMMNKKKPPRPQRKKAVATVYTNRVVNSDIPITITTSGNLVAKNKVEIFSEVQGVFERNTKEFKPGIFYNKGESLLKVNSSEHSASLQAQKSSLYNQLVLLLPDLRLDYPESFPKWEAYVRNFSMDKPLESLPEPTTEKEKLFISGRNIFTGYYNVRNQEVRLSKYNIKAPFYGVLTEALVTPGTLIRMGQKLGEFIDPSTYEMEVAINAAYSKLLRIGEKVELRDLEKTAKWTGKVIRINGKIDQASQTVKVYIQVRSKELKEGMYLLAEVGAKEEKNTFEISRKLLMDDSKLFVVRDTVLVLQTINPVYFKEKTVIVRGLEDGTLILSKPVPGAYSGMRVNALDASTIISSNDD